MTNNLDLLLSIRGGLPESCDFCKQPYKDGRYPVPEEAGAWACSDCEARWLKEDAPARYASCEKKEAAHEN